MVTEHGLCGGLVFKLHILGMMLCLFVELTCSEYQARGVVEVCGKPDVH